MVRARAMRARQSSRPISCIVVPSGGESKIATNCCSNSLEDKALLHVELFRKWLESSIYSSLGPAILGQSSQRLLSSVKHRSHTFFCKTFGNSFFIIGKRIGMRKNHATDGYHFAEMFNTWLHNACKRKPPSLITIFWFGNESCINELGYQDGVGKILVGHGVNVFRIHPVKLFRIKCGGIFRNMLKREGLCKCFARNNSCFSIWRPTEKSEVVYECIGEIACIAVFFHACCTMAFRELFAVSAQNHGDVCKHRHWSAQRLVYHDLPRRVGKVIVSTNNVGDLHGCIINNGGEIISRCSIRAEDNKIV